MMIEIVNFDGRSFRVSWVPGHYPPNDFQVVQASAVCFANRGAVVLLSAGGGAWGLPGGHIEPGESAAALCGVRFLKRRRLQFSQRNISDLLVFSQRQEASPSTSLDSGPM